tara:strand:+ start:826 stop:1113 length:288 start_codon:yes stop_codon:yes gene_type:complete
MLLNLLITIGGRFTGTASELNDVNISSLKRFSNTISFRDIWKVMGDALHQRIDVGQKQMVKPISPLDNLVRELLNRSLLQLVLNSNVTSEWQSRA